MSFLDYMPFEDESVSAIMRRYMDQTHPLFDMTQIIMRIGECNFNAGQRELIAAYTSGNNRCKYCYGTHKSTAEVFGVDSNLLENLLYDFDNAAIEPSLIPVLKYIKKLTLSPNRLIQEDVDAILSAGWDENDFHYIVMIGAWFNFFNRLVDGYGTTNTESYQAARGKALAETGYTLSK